MSVNESVPGLQHLRDVEQAVIDDLHAQKIKQQVELTRAHEALANTEVLLARASKKVADYQATIDREEALPDDTPGPDDPTNIPEPDPGVPLPPIDPAEGEE